MKRRERLVGFAILPLIVSILSAYYKLLWLVPVVVVLMFVLVAMLPFCRKHENLWIFVLTAFCALPINWLIIIKFDAWMDYLYIGYGNISYFLVIVEYMMILTGLEEIIFGIVTRYIWKKQYKLYIPVDDEDEG